MKNIFLTTAAVFFLSSCSSLDVATSEARRDIQDNADTLIADGKAKEYNQDVMSRINYVNKFYVPELLESQKEKPQWFFKDYSANIKNFTLAQFATDLQEQYSINSRYVDALNDQKSFSIVTDGTVGDALEKVKLATSYGFSIEGDTVAWSKFVTEFIDISSLPGIQSMRIGTIDEQGGAGGQGQQQTLGNAIITDTGISQDTSYSALELEDSNVLNSILTTANMLKSTEGKVNLDLATSSLIVRDYPDYVRQIKEFAQMQNNRLTAQAVFDILIIDYVKSKGDEVSVNFEAIKNDLASSGIQTLSTNFASSLISSVSPTIFTYTKRDGKYAGATVFLEALKSRGLVLNSINPKILVSNNKASKIVDSADQSYLASAGSAATANVGQTDILIPGIVKTGLKLWAIADIDLNTKTVTGMIDNSFSDLQEISSASSGTSTIQTPSTTSSDFSQHFTLKDGESFLLGGLGSRRQEVNENVGGFIGLGGEKGARYVETETLILVTPRIIRR
ncbi:hypothetical protein WE348_20845 (plasmid) [Alteromonas macleodii]|uniref:hypothetical protein n=1 Tax=Alteromonas macleodii TaxID=28108 RepID=UPI0030D35963